MKTIFSLLFLTSLLLTGACQSSSPSADGITKEATLRWTGMIAADGCGYFLNIDGQEHKPSNEEAIPEAFQQYDSLQVMVTYAPLEEPQEFSCGMMPTRYTSSIRIIDISQKKQ